MALMLAETKLPNQNRFSGFNTEIVTGECYPDRGRYLRNRQDEHSGGRSAELRFFAAMTFFRQLSQRQPLMMRENKSERNHGGKCDQPQ